MFRRTFAAFLNSLSRQTDQDFKLLLVGHEKPGWAAEYDRFIVWHSVSADPSNNTTKVLQGTPSRLDEPLVYKSVPYDDTLFDMSMKTKEGLIQAGIYANSVGLPGYWVLRMDSDDLLARDVVARLNQLDTSKTRAMFCRVCHMYDPRRNELAEHRHPYSLTSNAIYLEIQDNRIKYWLYHHAPHTSFVSTVAKDNIPFVEWEWTLCITTNSGNSLSARPALSDAVRYDSKALTTEIPVSQDIVERYGLNGYQEML